MRETETEIEEQQLQSTYSFPEGGVDGRSAGGNTFVSGGSTLPIRGGWINPWRGRGLAASAAPVGSGIRGLVMWDRETRAGLTE